ncbi:MAG TPA: branched-chain amino acid ABC transporter substrate-binding protein [Ktedonobacteraceae bacterium]|nr:branched-chain amino acid ABC transporter substrate-binding protein [Ktedonobacteraceae bacterium]
MQKRRSRIFALAMAIPLLLALLAACGAGTGGNPGGSNSGPIVIKIGSDFPTTGGDASAGKPAENGAHLAVDEANANHVIPNVNFVFVPKDDVGPQGTHDGATGQKNITDLIGDAQVAGVVGPLNSSVAVSELPVANQAPIALISPANTNDCLTQTTPASECGGQNNKIPTYRPTGKVTYFRIATRDFYQGGALADFGFKTKGYKKVYIIDDTETYGVGIAGAFENEWKNLGGTVIDHKSVPPTTTSFVNLLTAAATANPDVIFFGGNDSTGGTLIREQMMQVPALKNTPFIAGDGTQTSAFAKAIKPLGGGDVFTSVAAVDITKLGGVAQNFISAYSAKYGANNISSYSGGSYDCAKIIIQAIKTAMSKGAVPPKDSGDAATAKTFRQAVIDAIQGIDYTGVTGHHTFDQNGDTTNRVITIKTIGDVNVADGWTTVTQVNIG